MRRYPIALLTAALWSTASEAQSSTQIRTRDLTPAEAVSGDTVGFLYGVRELSDGRVLVNDAGARRVLLLDRALQTSTIVADSGIGRGTSYGRRPTGIIAYASDTTLLVDLTARAFLVIDPKGAIVRVMSAPRPGDMNFMWNPAFGTPVFDPKGRLIYRGWLMPRMAGLGGEHGTGGGGGARGAAALTPAIADSAPLLRGDFDTRAVDTLAWVRIPKMRATMTPVPGGMRMVPTINPLSTVDDWVALSDGSIAVLRGQDYHIDWVAADGTRSTSAKMPFDWKRLTAEEKAAIVDSTRQRLAREASLGVVGGNVSAAAAASMPLPNPMMATPHTMPTAGASTEADPSPRRPMTADTARVTADVVPPEELPDYVPPVLKSGTMKVDPEGNIWILPSTSASGAAGLVYDVINRRGEIFQRVRLPAGRALEGFGAGGAVYLSSHGGGGTRIERARLK
jgi:hypothetical protein